MIVMGLNIYHVNAHISSCGCCNNARILLWCYRICTLPGANRSPSVLIKNILNPAAHTHKQVVV